MVLSDVEIRDRLERGNLGVVPLDESNIEPSSIDLHLGDTFKYVIKREKDGVVDLKGDGDVLGYDEEEDFITVEPGDFILATTKERISLPPDLSANVLGRSSFGRLGLSVHQTAGYIDPGFVGQITLELSNHGPAPVRLHAGQRVCQIVFHELGVAAERPYGHNDSQYQNQSGPTESGMKFD